jgi:hypothetical protein
MQTYEEGAVRLIVERNVTTNECAAYTQCCEDGIWYDDEALCDFVTADPGEGWNAAITAALLAGYAPNAHGFTRLDNNGTQYRWFVPLVED